MSTMGAKWVSTFAAAWVCLAASAADIVVPEGGLTITDDAIADYAGKSFEVASGRTLDFSLNLSSSVRLGAISGAGDVTIANAGKSNLYLGSLKEFTGNMSGNGFGFGDTWSTAIHLNGKVTGARSINSYNYTTYFWAQNVLPSDQTVTTGHGAYAHGALDFNGFSQTLGDVLFVGSVDSSATESSADYELRSAAAATLTVTKRLGWYSGYPKDGGKIRINGHLSLRLTGADTSVYLRGASTTDGQIAIETGEVMLGSSFTAANLTNVTVSGSGHLTFVTTAGLPKATLAVIGEDARVILTESATTEVNLLTIDGAGVRPKTYTAEEISQLSGGRISGGALKVKARLPVPVTTYTWVGGGADDSVSTAANWQGGVVPKLLGGSELLDFTAGTSVTFPAGESDIYGIRLSTGTAFELKGADDAQLLLNEGGVSVTAPDSGERALTFAIAPQLLTAQAWSVPASTKVVLSKGWSGTGTVTESGKGRIVFASDTTPPFTGRLMMADGATVELAGAGGIGADGSYLNLPEQAGLKVTGTCVTNRTAMTFAHGEAQTWSPAGSEVYFLGAITNNTSGGRNSNILVDGRLHLRGGLYCSAEHRANPNAYIWWWWKFCIHPTTGEAWIENKPIDVGGCGVYLQQRSNGCGRLHLGVAGNTFGRIVTTFGSTIICDVPDALCATGDVDDYHLWVGFLNLNGCDQTIRDLRMQDSVNGGGKPMLGYNGQINSSQPAVLTITGANAGTPAAFRFMDRAGLHYAGTGALVLSNETSTSTGPLKVSSGEVRLCRGATWANCTNVVVTGTGKLTLEERLFASRVFASTVDIDIADDGTVWVPAGQTLVISHLSIDGLAQPRGSYTTGFVQGGGTIKVTKSYRPRGLTLLVR